jgi:hypothetical protein
VWARPSAIGGSSIPSVAEALTKPDPLEAQWLSPLQLQPHLQVVLAAFAGEAGASIDE